MEFILAQYKDYEAVAQLHNNSEIYGQSLTLDAEASQERFEELCAIWQTRLTNPPFNQHVILVSQQEQLVGLICLFANHDFERGGLIDALYVDERLQHQGIGRELVKRAAIWQKQHFDRNGVYLKISSAYKAALKFYQELGADIDSSDEEQIIVSWDSVDELCEHIAS